MKKLRNEKNVTQEELAKYYEVEVDELLDGERKDPVENKTEEILLKVADYNKIERAFFSKKMCLMFTVAILGMVILAIIDILALERTQPYATIVSTTGGFVSGTFVCQPVYRKTEGVQMRLIKSLHKKKGTF